MSATITIVRSAELRGRQGTYDVAIDTVSVGTLQRGQSLSHEVPAGQHTVKVTRDEQHTSPTKTVDLADGEGLTLHVGLLSERAAYLRSPIRPSDHLVLTTDAPPDSDTPVPAEARVRLVLLALGFAALAISLVAPAGPVKRISYAVWIVAVVVGFILVVRHMRRLYKSPRKG